MLNIPIQAIPNQSFGITIGNDLYQFILKTIADFTAVSIARNSVSIIDGSRTPAGAPILPYRYEESGNFMFLSNGFQLPFYTNFNMTQTLVYFSAAELAAFRAIPPPNFSPIAALPLRYAPDYSDPILTTNTGIGITTQDGTQIAVALTNENPVITTNIGQIVTTETGDQITT